MAPGSRENYKDLVTGVKAIKNWKAGSKVPLSVKVVHIVVNAMILGL